jgi:hypothetical protein
MPRQPDNPDTTSRDHEYPRYRSHFLPRTPRGWIAVMLFSGLLALTQPPAVYAIANRIEPWLLGVPFLYGYLLIIYCALIAVLFWAQRKEL